MFDGPEGQETSLKMHCFRFSNEIDLKNSKLRELKKTFANKAL